MSLNAALATPLLPKPIRSFVHRQAGLSQRREKALDTLLTPYSLPLNQGLLKPEQIFQRAAPTNLEIGFGMGQNLLAQAQQYPEQNFLGIEVHRPGIAALLLGIESVKLSNLKIIYADAVEVFDCCIANNSLDVIQIFFPDPWPKRKHHKRRLIQAEFTKQLQNKLKTGGQLQLATDWQDYAEHMLFVLENTPGLKNSAGENKFSPRLSQRSLTKFEQRGQQLGHLIWDLLFYSVEKNL
ncbi:MAG: tRNA (guanosine(46)-N7)-methyltransferase TrmB [Pseudomonadota bacterium]